VRTWAAVQDACCAAPSDWLDAGQSDSYVTTVPSGFIREVVVDPRCYNKETKRGAPMRKPSVYYHYFEEVLVGPKRTRKVQRTALLRARRGTTVRADETVENFLVRHPHVRVRGRVLQLKDFVFETGTRDAAPLAAATGSRKVGKAASEAAAAKAKQVRVKYALLPALPSRARRRQCNFWRMMR
jgi:hypothetical protein